MPTLAEIRSRIGPELGLEVYHKGTCDASSTIAQVVELAPPVLSQYTGSDYFVGKWILLSDTVRTDRVRLIREYDPGAGALIVDSAWLTPPSGTFEIFNLVNPLEGMITMINQALCRISLVAEWSQLPTSATAQRHLITCPWIVDEAQVYAVGILPTALSREDNEPIWRAGEVEQDGEKLYLKLGVVSSNYTIYVKARKRTYDHCKPAGGAYGDQVGLALDTDSCPGDLDWIAAAVMVELWAHLTSLMTEAQAKGIVKLDQAQAAALFSDLTAKHWRPPRVSFRRVIPWGPRR